MGIFIGILLGIWALVAMLMMLVILMQRPKSEGLGAAFGGAVTENLFGAQTTNVLVKFTAWLAGIFFVITFVLSVLYAHRSMGGSTLSKELKKTAPAAATVPAISPSPAPAGQASPATATSPATGPAAGTTSAATAPAAVTTGSPATATQQNAAGSPSPAQSPKP
ncbi:MAG TPA: preprotein translocase subunit SecG [Chthoniobacterales bacterium]|nr:preprotein translocase subunit SecG [Chthoniobacterales bacterium]